MKNLLTAFLLMLPCTIIADTNNKSDDIVSRAKARSEIINSISNDIVMQLVIPPQYSQCLFASFSEAQVKNEYAHAYFLGEIDYLYKQGLTKANIIGLISYGHSITNIYYGSSAGKNVSQIDVEDLSKLREFNKSIFYKYSCTDYAKESYRKELTDLILSTHNKKQKK